MDFSNIGNIPNKLGRECQYNCYRIKFQKKKKPTISRTRLDSKSDFVNKLCLTGTDQTGYLQKSHNRP